MYNLIIQNMTNLPIKYVNILNEISWGKKKTEKLTRNRLENID